MTDQVVTELVIETDTTKVGDYERAMASAEQAARGGIDANNAYIAALAGIGAGAIAAVAGIKSIMDQVLQANKQLADMATFAKNVGLSLADLQGIKFGGAVAGVDEKAINAGLQESAKLLNDASRNSNSLSKELEANGISIKNANGQLISQNQLLGIAADLVRRARNPGDANAIAEMLGFTKEWVPLLEQGKGAIAGLTDEAKKAGVVIDDETVRRARDFDREWRKSSVTFEYNMKAALLGLVPYVDDLIDGAARFIKSIDREKIQKHADEALQALEKNTGLPHEGGIQIVIAPDTERAFKDFTDDSKTIWQRIVAAAELLRSAGSKTDFHVVEPQDVKWYGGTSSVMDTSEATMQASIRNAAAWTAEGAAWKTFSDSIVVGSARMGEAFSNVAGKQEANDAVDRAINTLRRHVEQQKADTEAIGLGDGAMARFRAQAAETAAVLANDGKETEKQRKQFAELKQQAELTADSFARMKIAAQIDFSSKTKFLSPEDVAIAQQLRGIYGNKIPEALASTQAAQLRVIDAQKLVAGGFRDIGESVLTAALKGGNAMAALNAGLDSLAAKMSKAGFNNAVDGLLSGNLAQAGLGAAELAGSAVMSAFTGDQKRQEQLRKDRVEWETTAPEFASFLQPAAAATNDNRKETDDERDKRRRVA